MTAEELRGLAFMSEALRQAGVHRVADLLDEEISTELVGSALEAEFERDLREHHRRLRDEHGDPFGGAR